MKGTRTDCFAYRPGRRSPRKKAIVFFTFIAIAILAISTYLIKVLITWIYMKMCRARKRRIEWLMKRQEERDREKCDQ